MTDQHHHPDDELLAALSEQWGREPWEPVRFEVGQEVLVRLSAECPQDFVAEGRRSGRIEPLPGHPVVLDGRSGVIVAVKRDDSAHDYRVAFDPPVRRENGRRIGSAIFAAAELIPLTADATRPSAEQGEGG